MKSLNNYILEKQNESIDSQWVNDEKPIKTIDGRQVIIYSIDRKQVPNVLKGSVKMNDSLFEFEWLDNGTCVKATDKLGNPKQPDNSDNLIKA